MTQRSICVLLGLAACARAEVLVLNEALMAMELQKGPLFVKFYAPWCGHCKRLAPTWDQLSEVELEGGVRVAKVDCTRESGLRSRFGVRGYPTLLMIADGGSTLKKHAGGRSVEALKKWANGDWKAAPEFDPTKIPPSPPNSTKKWLVYIIVGIVIVSMTIAMLVWLCADSKPHPPLRPKWKEGTGEEFKAEELKAE